MISGAEGFIGTALTKNLKDHKVYRLKHSRSFSQNKNQFNLDLTNPGHVDKLIKKTKDLKIEALFHLAAITPYSGQKEHINFSDDLKMAELVKKICDNLNIKRFIFPSGWIVYSPKANIPISENSLLKPNTDYGKSKLKLEKFFKENLKGLQVIILRISSVYGPGQESSGLIPTLVKAAFNRHEMKITSAVRRDYLYVEDLTMILRSLIHLKIRNNLILNIGSGKSTEVIKVARIIKSQLSKNFKISPKISFCQSSFDMPTDNLLDITKARKILRLKKFRQLDRGLYQYIKWYKNKNQ